MPAAMRIQLSLRSRNSCGLNLGALLNLRVALSLAQATQSPQQHPAGSASATQSERVSIRRDPLGRNAGSRVLCSTQPAGYLPEWAVPAATRRCTLHATRTKSLRSRTAGRARTSAAEHPGWLPAQPEQKPLLLAASTVRTVLNQLNEVVGEGPEEALANLQGTSVLVLLECGGCFLNQVRQASQQGTVQR